MPDRPTASELIEAVFEFLAGEVLPTADDQRLRFRTLVAMNALGIARRELEAPSNSLLLDHGQLADLAARIRAFVGRDAALFQGSAIAGECPLNNVAGWIRVAASAPRTSPSSESSTTSGTRERLTSSVWFIQTSRTINQVETPRLDSTRFVGRSRESQALFLTAFIPLISARQDSSAA